MKFRPIKLEDQAKYLQMMKRFYSGPAALHEIPEDNMKKTLQETIASSPYVKCYIFEENEVICGYGLLTMTYSNEAGGLVVWLDEIYIEDEYRGRGIGSQFIQFVFEHHPAKRYRLEVSKENARAAKLYEKLGFQPLEYEQMVIDR